MSEVTLLIADDSLLTRTIVRKALTMDGLRIVEAASGRQAIQALNEHHPEIVILDISMPAPDGMAILRQMRKDEEFCNTPVILMTVEGSVNCYNEAENLGISAYYVKPLDLRMMRNRITILIDQVKAERTQDDQP
jgi:DNA-binding response OmpR family regulator